MSVVTKTSIVMCPMTGVGIPGYKGDGWLRDRISIFKQYTLKSLLNQTDKDFMLWMTFREEEEWNRDVDELGDYLGENKVNFLFTFDGLMYHDDKFGGDPIHRAKNIVRLVRQAWRNKSWKEIKYIRHILRNKNATLVTRLRKSLVKIQRIGELMGWNFGDAIYLSRIDSDDMFHEGYLEAVKSTDSVLKDIAILCKGGYLYDHFFKELAEWNPTTNPPFHTIVFPPETFFDPEKHLAHYKGYESHEDMVRFPHKFLNERMYCVLIHNPINHISTVWNHPFRGPVITNGKEEILKGFGI